MKKVFLFVFSMLFIFVAASGICFSADKGIAKFAEDQGVKTCLSVIKYMENFLLESYDHSKIHIWSKEAPDKHIFNSFIVKKYSDINSIISLTVSPNKGETCDVTYQETFYLPGSCMAAKEEVFKEYKFVKDTKGTVWLTNRNESVDVYMTPAKDGCGIVKQEAIIAMDPLKIENK